ncbi:MAG: PKD domain-containing protein [Bacteroidetes bacterium]|nr:PKD domain-containing protein [Bacteroidota bacterium]
MLLQLSPTHTYGNNGTYTATLIAMNAFGCSDTIQQTVQVNGPPVASAGPDVTICIGSNATLTANGGVLFNPWHQEEVRVKPFRFLQPPILLIRLL